MRDRDLLRDAATHRQPDEVHRRQPEHVDQRHGVVGDVGTRVVRLPGRRRGRRSL
jgi:hypothetical protein